MGRDHVAVGWCSRAFVLLALFGAVMVLVGGVSAVSAVAGLVKPVVTKDNDANHDGVFSGTESLPTNVSYSLGDHVSADADGWHVFAPPHRDQRRSDELT